MTSGSVMREINFLGPRQWEQTRTSISKVLFINSAHVRHLLAGGLSGEWEHRFEESSESGTGTIESLQDAAGASTPW